MNSSEGLSRESLAGYDPAVIDNATIAQIGAGAGGNSEIQNTALVGVREHRLVDHDSIDPSNLTRSPLFARIPAEPSKPKYKAREVARAVLAISRARDPIVRYAVSRIEALGLGALQGSGVIIAAVDSPSARAYLTDCARILGIPLVHGGFSGSQGWFATFPNQSADEPCWRCMNPAVEPTGLSCGAYAEAAVERGLVPATQPLAATIGALIAEAAIEALHGRFPMGNRMFHIDIRTGESRVVGLTADPRCPGVHKRFGAIRRIPVGPKDQVSRVISTAREFAARPIVHLPSPVILEAPCARCGRPVQVRRPAWALDRPPVCPGGCVAEVAETAGTTQVVSTVRREDSWARLACRMLGLPAGAIFEIEDEASDECFAVQLLGSVDDLFVTKRRAEREPAATPHDEPHANDVSSGSDAESRLGYVTD